MGNGVKRFALKKSGLAIPVEVSLSTIDADHGRVVSQAIRDGRERQQADGTLRAAKNLAESALAAKSCFLTTASHDLPQPIQSLMLLSSALHETIEKPFAKKMLAMQSKSLAGMARL